MIIVKFSGGLGNQMFEYAAGRRLAFAKKTELSFDLNDLSADPKRAFSLNSFAISGREATSKDLIRFFVPKNIFLRKVVSKLERAGLLKNSKKITEKDFLSFDPAVISWGSVDAYMDGFWQSEKYFLDVADVIRREFSLVSVSESAAKAFQAAQESESVSVHFRRGDYVSDPGINADHGSCGPGYYREAIALATENMKDPKLFIFSDDAKWVKENFKSAAKCVYVSDFGLTDPEEIILMSRCRNNVLANSSFGWWGAWLNQNPAKVVVAPKKWFAKMRVVEADRFPDSWIKI